MIRCRGLASSWSGTIYRTAGVEFATEQELLSGMGSQIHGGRWNPPGFRAVYGCLEVETSFSESLAHSQYFGIPVEETLPVATAAAQVSLQWVVNLREAKIRQELKVSLKRMRGEDWRKEQEQGREALTQAIGRAAFEARLEAILAPSSVRKTAPNIVVFPQNLDQSSILQPINPQRLPRNPRN